VKNTWHGRKHPFRAASRRYRLVELLVEGATLYTDHLTMEIKTEGVKSLMEEVENESNLNDN
jgi:hypothetical protein